MNLIKKEPLVLFISLIASFSLILEMNIIPYTFKMLLDGIINSNNRIFNNISFALWIGGGSWIMLIVIIRLARWWQAYIIPRFESDIRISLIDHLMSHSYNYFSTKLSGNTANKINDLPRALEAIRRIVSWNCIPTFAVVVTALIMMSTVNFLFSCILGGWIIVHLSVIIYFINIVNNASERNAEDKSALNGVIVDTISNIITVKLFARSLYELEYIQNKQAQEKISNTSLILTTVIFEIWMDVPITIMLVSTFYLLIESWLTNTITIANFVFIVNMAFAILYQVWHFGNVLVELFREIGIAQQALKLILPHQIIDIEDAKPLKVIEGKIEFNNVTFRYNHGQDTFIFKNKNVLIKSGEKIGVVGLSGSGKTTFINLILRFFDLESGTITIDDQDISKVTQDSLRQNISVILQDTYLFHRTLMENIRYGLINSSDEEVIEASKQAYCHDFINTLPNGYNSIVGERGINLSGGQRQRISIARAILKKAPILILDEASSALDSITENQVQKSFQMLMQNRTSIVIAHRLSTLRNMDRILVFDKGSIVEEGSHIELLKLNGYYTCIWNMQAGGFLIDNY